MKNFFIFGVILVGIGIGVWFFWPKSQNTDSEVVARNGLHWHSNLTINILGDYQDIPAGIGLAGLPHKPMHTHDRDNVIHMEFAGLVLKKDIKLGKFFQAWGKTFNKECIFDKCSGGQGTLKMLVNGSENLEFDNYMMKDEDKIEIVFDANEAAGQEEQIDSEIKEIAITGNDFSFSPSKITIKAGQKVKIVFENKGSVHHNLIIEELGISTKTIGNGQTDSVEFIASTQGKFDIICSVPGHKELGMKAELIIE